MSLSESYKMLISSELMDDIAKFAAERIGKDSALTVQDETTRIASMFFKYIVASLRGMESNVNVCAPVHIFSDATIEEIVKCNLFENPMMFISMIVSAIKREMPAKITSRL